MNPECPICGEPSAPRAQSFSPFCSQRCQLVDLGRWLDEDYRIPGEPADGDEERAADEAELGDEM
jgi:uncharacterized protein